MQAGLCRFAPLDLEVLMEKCLVGLGFLKLMRCQHHRQYRHFGLQLNLHHRLEYGGSDKIMAIDATIHNQTGRHYQRIVAALGQQLRLQWNLQAAGNFK